MGNPWRYASKRVDPESGFVYFGRRYYAPLFGRWITPDPQEFEDGPNLYAYLHNNPLTYFDEYGLEASASGGWGFGWVATGWSVTCDLGCGVFNGFVHPIDTTGEWAGSSQSNGTASSASKSTRVGEFCGVIAACVSFYSGATFAIAAGKVAIGQTVRFAARVGTNIAANQASKAAAREASRLAVKKTAESVIKAEANASAQVVKKGAPSLDELSKAGQAMDRECLTKAGRALDKHGNRPGTIFPKATGNPVNKNMQGQHHLDDILTDPKSSIIRDFEKGSIKIYAQDGRGAYFKNDGTLRGFIERQYE